MSESAYRVETTPRLAQWKIENLASCTYRKSDIFKIGNWNWYLSIEKNKGISIKLYPEISSFTRNNPPIASFAIRVLSSVGGRKVLSHTDVKDKHLKKIDDFVWVLDEVPLTGQLIIEVEFTDLKTASSDLLAACEPDPNLENLQEGEPSSIWNNKSTEQRSNTTALTSLNRMFSESIHTDITIKTSNGSIKAHRSILASRSTVFHNMFSHDLIEKQLSTVYISDMSQDDLTTFLNYLYSNLNHDQFLVNRLALIRAADKYDIFDLKEECEVSLMEDIDVTNVLERLESAQLYKLGNLKDGCINYLVKFGKIFDVRGELDEYVRYADRELIGEMLHEILCAWRGF